MQAKLDIPSIMPCGFLFIWVEKELTPQILKIGQAWGFRYVENFAWIKREKNNKIARQAYRYFNRSKTTCLILRKERKVGFLSTFLWPNGSSQSLANPRMAMSNCAIKGVRIASLTSSSRCCQVSAMIRENNTRGNLASKVPHQIK